MKRKSYILEGAGIILFLLMFFFVLLPNIGSSKVRRVQSPIAYKESGGTRSYLHEIILPDGSTSATGSAGWRAVTVNFNRYGIDTATNDSYTVTFSPPITAYADGLILYFDANNPNTGACSINANGLGAKAIKTTGHDDPPDNYIEANTRVQIMYDGTNFQLLSPDANPGA